MGIKQQSHVKAIVMEIKRVQVLREFIQFLDRFDEIMGPNDYDLPKESDDDSHPIYKLTLY